MHMKMCIYLNRGERVKNIGLYIHIPFCERKCFYCDFLSFTNREDLVEKYIDYLKKELNLYKERLIDYEINTIFIGGGTPSHIEAKYIEKLLTYIYKNFNTARLEEVSIEVNPKGLNKEKAKAYKRAGINRISLGLQTLNDNHLKSIGRLHRKEDFIVSYEILKDLGFNNINVDLIFGLPGQTVEDVIYDVENICQLDIKHLSYYSLILEEGTLMHKLYEKGRLDLPDEEEERQMYYTIVESLGKEGFIHYEISNFAKENYQCIHNKYYWEIKPYIGIGMGSHSNFDGKRYWNSRRFDEYFAKLDQGQYPIIGQEKIDKKMEMAEYCIMGIRLIKGINRTLFKERFKVDLEDIYGQVIDKNINRGLIKIDGEYLRLTRLGLDLANQVEMDFLP